ncbi:MAG: maleylpyruvate isomerase family mycothiol-dependent enzyme [Acidimicrobiales bacterium]
MSLAGVTWEVAVARVDGGTAFFSDQLDRVNAENYDGPSVLDGWSRRVLIAHVTRNAMALTNLCNWAISGEECPMYASPEDRQRGIDEYAAMSEDRQRERFNTTASVLREQLDRLSAGGLLEFTVRTARGREVPVREVAVMRAKELWIHGVDLDLGAGFDELPRGYLIELLDELVLTLSSRAEPTGVEIRLTDLGDSRASANAPEGVVSGTLSAVVAWLSGRSSGQGLEFDRVNPVLKPWF